MAARLNALLLHEFNLRVLGLRPTVFQILVNLLAAIPLMLILYDYAADLLFSFGGQAPWVQAVLPLLPQKFNINPIQDLTLRTGKAALIMLVASLAATPINTLLRYKHALRVRKDIGLWSFFYALLHILIYIVLDYGLDFNLIWLELSQKLYVIVGFSAFLILLPLALTSTKGWQRRLGRWWKRLHNLVYLAALFAVGHFIWVVKSDYREPAVWGIIVCILLAVRIPTIKKWINTLHNRWQRRSAAQTPAP